MKMSTLLVHGAYCYTFWLKGTQKENAGTYDSGMVCDELKAWQKYRKYTIQTFRFKIH
jgi:hypothetical protein